MYYISRLLNTIIRHLILLKRLPSAMPWSMVTELLMAKRVPNQLTSGWQLHTGLNTASVGSVGPVCRFGCFPGLWSLSNWWLSCDHRAWRSLLRQACIFCQERSAPVFTGLGCGRTYGMVDHPSEVSHNILRVLWAATARLGPRVGAGAEGLDFPGIWQPDLECSAAAWVGAFIM